MLSNEHESAFHLRRFLFVSELYFQLVRAEFQMDEADGVLMVGIGFSRKENQIKAQER